MPHTSAPTVVAPDGTIAGERLSEKPVPEKYRQAHAEIVRDRRYTPKDRFWVEGNMKLDWYYGGELVVYLDLGDDWIVIAHGDDDDDSIYQTIESLPPDLRPKAVMAFPESWQN